MSVVVYEVQRTGITLSYSNNPETRLIRGVNISKREESVLRRPPCKQVDHVMAEFDDDMGYALL
jgi:hypothetical protein